MDFLAVYRCFLDQEMAVSYNKALVDVSSLFLNRQ
jgi:hypothetical protein